jgi:hypothetical protein
MEPKKLSPKDKELFDRYLRLTEHELSVYAFENIYIWKGLFDISWKIIEDNLCVFFKDKIGCFLYIPPQGKHIRPAAVREVFRIMDRYNSNKDISRIENVETGELSFYKGLGYDYRYKFSDYICDRQELVDLTGNRFKSKRACLNYFLKHYKFRYLPFSLKGKNDCLKLYNLWMAERKTKFKDLIYQAMLQDSQACLKILLKYYQGLDLKGRIVEIDNRIKAFSFGFELNKDIFSILYEITDLSIKGLSQFIFHSFCSELKGYRYINVMDDSGLENLKKVKLSYHPVRLAPSYIIKRSNG